MVKRKQIKKSEKIESENKEETIIEIPKSIKDQSSPKETQNDKFSDDLFPNFQSLSINTSVKDQLIIDQLSQINDYQSLHNQISKSFKDHFIQLSKFKISQNGSITSSNYDLTLHEAKYHTSINKNGEIELLETKSKYNHKRQFMALPNSQCRQVEISFQQDIKKLIDLANLQQNLHKIVKK
ncbi:hypothetical protein WICMUC_002104 [Wickerhamomyces mucosus]|uniref:Uncharacterized protein n=1 Tax=Wickerhamomyces mucosus TaxID=1378264 RepID=A0A9P8TE86_9ASCO|nr:hypothetical protein WICMUC_002104 [Wickerhamomyces mucosus]